MSVLIDFDETGSAASIVYREIKQRIVNLHYQVGERLSEARLAEELGVKRSPIRTALSRLKCEGWIAISPQSGTYVKALKLHEIREIADLRILLEMHVASDAARQMSDVALAALRADLRAYKRRVLKGDLDAFVAIDNQVHEAIYAAANNNLIRQTLLGLRDKVQWIRRAGSISIERIQDSYAELERLLDALEQRNARRAARVMREHLKNALAFVERLEQAGGGVFAFDKPQLKVG